MAAVRNIAHRGASGEHPENTLAAFRAAIGEGADCCELDVQCSADGVLVVVHDDRIDRTTDGAGSVARLTLAQLKALDAGRWRDARFAGERIPSLEEVCKAVAGKCALNVELKAAGIEAQVCDLVRGAAPSSILSSFDWAALARVRQMAPELGVGLLASRGRARLLDSAVELRALAVHPRYDLVDASFCADAHRRGLLVYVWTVDEVATMARLIAAGVDGIMTNYPARLRALLQDGAVQSE